MSLLGLFLIEKIEKGSRKKKKVREREERER